MRRRRSTLVVLPAALLGALLLAAWLIPPQLDWARYRGTIAQLASTRLGLPVTIGGPVGLRLLPEPVLTAGDVGIGNPARDGMTIQVRALRLRVGLLPLLAGRIDARTLVLRRPALHIPWPAPAGTLHVAPPAGLAAFHARIESGRLSVGQFAVTGIDGTLSSRSNVLAATVTADLAGQHWHAAARLSNAGLDGASAITVRLRGEGRASGITAGFTGRLMAAGVLDGRVTAAGPDLSLLLPTPALGFQAQGRLTVADGLAEMDELKTRLGGLPAIAAVALNVLPRPQLDIALSADRLNLDPWLPLLRREPAEQRLLPIGLDVSARTASLAGATLQHLRATFELVPGAVRVRRIAAEVPGNATLQLAGRIAAGGGSGPVFTGTGQLQAPVLRTTLHWLLPQAAESLAALPQDVAQRADLAGTLRVEADRVAIGDLRGQLDGDALSGSLGWQTGKPPSVTADLQLGRMRLGPWLARRGAMVRLRQLVLHRLDTDLRLQVKQASLDGTAVDGLALHVATRGGGVTLHRLHAQMLGATLSASGSLSAKGDVGNAHLLLTTANAMTLADLLPVAWRATPALWFGPARLEITAKGPRNAVASRIALHLGDLRLHLRPTLNLAAGTASGSITAQDPNALRLISDFGVPARLGLHGVPAWLGEGSLSLVAQLGVGQRRVSLQHGALVAGRLRTRLDLLLDFAGDRPRLTGSVAAETLPLPVPGHGPLPMALLHGWQAKLQVTASRIVAGDTTLLRDASTRVRLRHGTLSLDRIGGKLGEGTLSASASLDAAQQPPALAVQGKLTGASIAHPVLRLPIDVTGGKADLALSLRAAGYSATALTASLSGVLKANVQDGSLSGFDLAGLGDRLQHADSEPTETSLREPLDGGQTPFRKLTLQGKLAHGILSLDKASLTGAAGTAEATGSVALPAAMADLQLVLKPAIPLGPSIGVLVSGALASPARTPELAGVTAWWSGRAH